MATKLGLANDNVVALTDFVNELNAHAETLNSVLVSMPDAPKDADTLDTVTLTMTTRDGQVGVKTLNNVPRDAAETLRTALEGAVDSVKVDTVTPTTTTASTPKATTSKATPTTSVPKAAPTTSKSTAPAATTTQRDGDKAGTDADLNASIDELRRIAAAIEAAKANNPQVIEEMLARLNDPSRGAGHADINTVTGKNVNTVQNVNANTGSTSVAINVNPDGGLSISAAQGTDGKGGTAQPGKDTTKDADAVIAALDNLAAALRGEKAPKADGAGTGTSTATAAPTSTMSADEAAQHDRLRRALLALTSPEREANSPASRERDALIMIAQALKDGKDINLEELTTEQMLQVMDWLQNGIPEMTKPDTTATAEPTATSTATEPTATAATSTTTESSTATTQPSAVTVTKTASPTTTTTTKKKKKDKDSDEADETDEASKELASAINGLAKGLAERHSTTAATTTTPSSKNKDDDAKRDNDERRVPVSTTSTTRVPADKQNNAGGGSGSGSNTGGSGSNKGTSGQSNGSAAQSNTGGGSVATETAAAAPAVEDEDTDTMQAEAVSEELAVTGNSTQRMLMVLILLGGVAAAALFVAMRRTCAE